MAPIGAACYAEFGLRSAVRVLQKVMLSFWVVTLHASIGRTPFEMFKVCGFDFFKFYVGDRGKFDTPDFSSQHWN